MEQKDYLIIAGVVLLLAGIFGYFFIFKKGGSDFKAPVMDGTSVFVSLNKINDPRPSMVYVHNGCPCIGQPMGQVFQNLAIEMQAFGSFYQMKVNPAKIQASFNPPYIALFIGGQLITGFQAGSVEDLQKFFLKLIGTVDKNPISGGVPAPSPTPGSPPPTSPTPGGTTPGTGGPISNIINGILGGGGKTPGTPGTSPGGIISNLIPGSGGGGILSNIGGGSGILNNVVKGVAPIANQVITNLSPADIKNIINMATTFDPSGISGTITGAIPDSVIEMARNWLIGLTKAQSLLIPY